MKAISKTIFIFASVFLIMSGCGKSPSWLHGTWVLNTEKMEELAKSEASGSKEGEVLVQFATAMGGILHTGIGPGMDVEFTKEEIIKKVAGSGGIGGVPPIREKYTVLKKGDDWVEIEIEKDYSITQGDKTIEVEQVKAKVFREDDGHLKFEQEIPLQDDTITLYLRRK